MSEIKDQEVVIDVPQGRMESTQNVKIIASRLKRTYVPPKRLDDMSDAQYRAIAILADEEFEVVVELAMAQGHNPLSKTFHYFKMDNKIFVDDHYAPLMNWAQKTAPFNYFTKVLGADEKSKIAGIEAGDVVVEARGIKRADESNRQSYFKTILQTAAAGGVDFDKALEIAERKADERFMTVATGVVKYSEFHFKNGNINPYATPKGWKPGEGRAEVRAIRNLIRRLVGYPTPEERKRLGLADTPQEVLKLAASVPAEIVDQGVAEEWMQLEAVTQKHHDERAERHANMTPEEIAAERADRINLLRGKPETGIGEDEEVMVETVVVVTNEEELEAVLDGEGKTNEFIAADEEYESRGITVEEAGPIILRSYRNSEEGVGKALEALLGLKSLKEVNDYSPIWLWNFYQYVLRRDILNNVNIPPADRLAAIPEIDPKREGAPKTIKEAGPYLHELLKTLCANNKKMQRLNG